MQSLIESKLLLASSEQLEGSTEIRLNLDYSNKRTKFKITAALQRETPQEVEHTMSAVDEDRKLYLQAAIVRIMKSRKILKHNALIQEVSRQWNHFRIFVYTFLTFFDFHCRFYPNQKSRSRRAFQWSKNVLKVWLINNTLKERRLVAMNTAM